LRLRNFYWKKFIVNDRVISLEDVTKVKSTNRRGRKGVMKRSQSIYFNLLTLRSLLQLSGLCG
jgi:hypothetical protein